MERGIQKQAPLGECKSRALTQGSIGPSLIAQTTTTGIVGTVTDPAGALVPDADVTARNLDTGEVCTTKSSSRGGFVFTEL